MAAHSYFTSPNSYPPRAYNPSHISPLEQCQWPGSTRDTAYNGSEGSIGASNQHVVLTPLSRPASPPKALGARFLSSLSNAQPAAGALTRKGSVLHSRARSLAAFVPKLNTSNSTLSEKSEKPHVPNKIFGDLFYGESAPIRLGAPVSPTKEKEESEFIMDYNPSFTERPSNTFKRRPTGESIVTPAPIRKSSWFTRKPTTTSTSTPKPTTDDLATLNITTTLFPNGPIDPLNPASFNDLLLNATALLTRMQTAYKEKLEYISTIQPEVEAQREEVEESETRSKHLKLQLEDMGRRAQEQEIAMQDLAQQLFAEKMKVHEVSEAARTVRLVRESDEMPRLRKRHSGGSASDSGFESDLESVFSAAGSGAETPATPPSIVSAASARQVKGVVSRAGNGGKRLGAEHAAWATVEALRDENRELRGRMEDMQREVQGCIDFVAAVHAV